MTPAYLQILKELEKYGIGTYVNLSPLFSELFKVNDTKDHSEIQAAMEKFSPIANVLTKNNYIDLKPSSQLHLGSGNMTKGFVWFDTYKYEATITPFGATYLSDLKNQELFEKVNNSVLQTNTNQRKISRASLVVAIAAAVVALLMFGETACKDWQSIHTNKQDTLLKTQVQELDSLSKNQQAMNKILDSLVKKVSK